MVSLILGMIRWTIWSGPGAIEAHLMHAHPDWYIWWAAPDRAKSPRGGTFLVVHTRIALAIRTAKEVIWVCSCQCNQAAVLWMAPPGCALHWRQNIWTAVSSAS